MGVEIILFSLPYLLDSEELDIAFSCSKKKKKKKERKKENSRHLELWKDMKVVLKKDFLDQSIFVFLHMSVSDDFSQYRETANSVLC